MTHDPGIAIRPERAGDEAAIRRVNDAAFRQPDESRIIDAVRAAGMAVLSLVATAGDGEVVGHILFTPVTSEPGSASPDAAPPSATSELRILALGPMAVLPRAQGRGIGSRLVREGLLECVRLGYQAVVVVGHPRFYPRFGFRPGREYHLRSNFDVPDEVFLVAELVPGALNGVTGMVRYTEQFGGS